MAIYWLNVQRLSRAAGRTATAAAAYRAGERIRDERTGRLHNHSARLDVLHKQIVLPASLAAAAGMAWAQQRASLWNAAERAERRRNSLVAREYQVALPAELTNAQRLQLARTFSQELADRHRVAVDLTIHAPRPEGDPRNFHAHLLATTREVGPSGFGAKTGIDASAAEAQRRGARRGIHELVALRERWAALTNSALQAANLSVRVDHRTLAAQGITREPGIPLPLSAYRAERRGEYSALAERVRAAYRARLASRQARMALSASRHGAPAGAGAEPPGAPQTTPDASDALEQLRKQSREAWLQLRERAGRQSEPARAAGMRASMTSDRDGRTAQHAPRETLDPSDPEHDL